jgi:hypothetical protein
MKSFLIGLLFTMGLFQLAFAQNPFRDQILIQARVITRATEKNDFNTQAKKAYPKIQELMGGSEKMAQALKEKSKKLFSMGIDLSEIQLGEPGNLFEAGQELHCLVSQTIVFETPPGKLKQESWLLAISNKEGKDWYFIDISNLNEKKIKELFPDFNPALKIPAEKKAQLLKED